jgi:hypothetical protein
MGLRRVVSSAARLVCAACAALVGGAASGQRPIRVGATPPARVAEDSARARVLGISDDGPQLGAWRVGAAPWWAPLASLVVPGAGQAAMRQTRGVAYFAAEAYAWVQALEFQREGNRRRSESRRSARQIARAPYAPTRDTSAWSYYEAIEENIESGPFSTTPGGPITPPTDLSTYNGKQWHDARAIFWDPDTPLPTSDPRYQRALEYYTEHAVKEEFRWTWRARQLEWDIYKADIARENQTSRDVTTTLVVIGVNHLVSTIDALASVRLRQARGAQGEQRIEATVPWPRRGRPRGEEPARRP